MSQVALRDVAQMNTHGINLGKFSNCSFLKLFENSHCERIWFIQEQRGLYQELVDFQLNLISEGSCPFSQLIEFTPKCIPIRSLRCDKCFNVPFIAGEVVDYRYESNEKESKIFTANSLQLLGSQNQQRKGLYLHLQPWLPIKSVQVSMGTNLAATFLMELKNMIVKTL